MRWPHTPGVLACLPLRCAALRCASLCCAALCCPVLCCAALPCTVLRCPACAAVCCGVLALCCAVDQQPWRHAGWCSSAGASQVCTWGAARVFSFAAQSCPLPSCASALIRPWPHPLPCTNKPSQGSPPDAQGGNALYPLHVICILCRDHLQMRNGWKGNVTHELLDVRFWLSQEAGIPLSHITGFRSPYLIHSPAIRQVSGFSAAVHGGGLGPAWAGWRSSMARLLPACACRCAHVVGVGRP